jgi:hypothetical protein
MSSSKNLYDGSIQFISTTYGAVTYTLEGLKGLIAALLEQKAPDSIRALDYTRAIPEDHEHGDEPLQGRRSLVAISEWRPESGLVKRRESWTGEEVVSCSGLWLVETVWLCRHWLSPTL